MAVNLTIPLTDTEQAKLVEVAALVAPNATAPQIKAWAEDVCKKALRSEVREIAQKAQREAENEARKTVEADWDTNWSEDVELAEDV